MMYLLAMSSTCLRRSARNWRCAGSAIAPRQPRLEHAVIVLERKLGVHRDHAGRLGQLQHAIGAVAVGQRVLEFEGVGRQQVAHQRLELHFAEGAARALVAQQLLQADDVAGQTVDLLLRLVDGGQPRHHVGEGLVGLLEALVQPLGDLAADLLQARVGGPGQRLDGGRRGAGEMLCSVLWISS